MVDSSGGARRTASVTVLFCDLVGSTARQSRLGDDAADEFRGEFFSALGDAVVATRGEIVKNTGDGLMVVFAASVTDAVTCASKMHDLVESLDVDERAYLRVGVSAGETAVADGDWFGTPVVEAARLCAAADAGQTLVSEKVRGLVGSRGGHQFRSLGSRKFKGLSEPLPIAAVIRSPIAATVAPTRRARRPRGWFAALAAVVLIALVASVVVIVARNDTKKAPVLAAATYTPRFVKTRCPGEFLTQVPNGVCGDLVVPEDRTKPRGRWIHIAVMRAPARSTRSAASPTIAISLGGFGEDAAKSAARDHGDLIMMPTRLSFDNPKMACPEFEAPARALLGEPQSDIAAIARVQAGLRACYQRLTRTGVSLSRYTLVDAGADVVDLLRALRLSSVDLAAYDSDALIALEVLREAPGVVRTLTLDNPVAPGFSFESDPTTIVGAAFDQYVKLCGTEPRCANGYPKLGAMLARNWHRFNSHPVMVDTTAYGAAHVRVRLDGDRSAKALAFALQDPATYALLAAGIASPPVDLLAQYGAQFDFLYVIPHIAEAAFLSSTCSYDRFTISPGRALSDRTRPELAGVDDGSVDWACAAWPVAKAPATLFTSAVSDVPTLLVTGGVDPFGSPDWATQLQGGLRNSQLLAFPTLGSGLLRNGLPPCLNDLRRRFLDDPAASLGTAATDCEHRSTPIDFVAPTS